MIFNQLIQSLNYTKQITPQQQQQPLRLQILSRKMMFAELAARKAASQVGGDGEINAQRPLNPFMVGQPVLQKKNVEKVFTDHDFPSYVQQSGNATSRLRLLDSIRLHNPLEIECTRFNLPSSRLNVLVLKDVLHLCGGLVGARFSSEELLQCKSLVKQLSDLWASIELKYKGLNASQKKIQWNAASSKSNSSEEANKEVEDVNRFFEETNEFLTELQELQELIRKVQDSVDPEEAAKFDNTDPESKIGKKMPDFLSVLLTRFNGGPLPESGKPAGLTVGKFAVYLSGLMGPSTKGQLTPSESEALSLLLQASNDCQSTFTNQQMDQNLSGCLPAMNQKYWAQRFFNFLSVMTELQSTPKDEKQLQNLA